MAKLWTTVASLLLAAIEPSTLLDVGTDGSFADSVCATMAVWGGRVISVAAEPRRGGPANLEVRTPYTPALVTSLARVEFVVLHGEPNWWTTTWQLVAVAASADAAEIPMPPIVVANAGVPWGRRDSYLDPESVPAEARQPHRRHGDEWVATDEGTARNGVLTAVEEFSQSRPGMEVIFLPGLGGAAVVLDVASSPSLSENARQLFDELRLPKQAVAFVEEVDAELRGQLARAGEASRRAEAARASAEDHDDLLKELDALRTRVGELAVQLADERLRATWAQARTSSLEELRYGTPIAADPNALAGRTGATGAAEAHNAGPSDEPSRALVRELLAPRELLRALGWPGREGEIALPIPCDRRGVVDPSALPSLVVIADYDPGPLRRTLCSVLDRAAEPVALTVALPRDASAPLDELLAALDVAVPAIELADAIELQPRSGARRLLAGEELPWGWPDPPSVVDASSIAYLVPGLPPEGSGGVNSVVQEARGLRELEAQARICVPSAALERAARLYGNRDSLFIAYPGDAAILDAVGDATVVVATEHTSVPLLTRLVRARPDLVPAYYVQDYEPLFAELGTPRSDQALLSYGAVPGVALFSKSHFVRNIVTALHNVTVAKVTPSLDRSVFNADGRSLKDAQRLTVIAMLRPRTPRRRPRATLAALMVIQDALRDDVEIVTFGCEASELDATGGQVAHLRHLGRLRSEEVADELRHSDVFIDGSAYQAFGRTGLEAMACGAVPVLPSLGGTVEYAIDGENAIVLSDDGPTSIAEAVIGLAGDRDRLKRLRAAGLKSAAQFSIDRAARSQLALFSFLQASPGGLDKAPWPVRAKG